MWLKIGDINQKIKMNNWIDIKDELPQPFKTVYIKKGNNIVKAYRGFDEETFLDAWYDDNGNMYDGSYNLWSYSYNEKLKSAEKRRLKLSISTEKEASKYIGKKCRKLSSKPFKSRLYENTINGVGYIHGKDGKDKLAFSFIEDDSLVSCQMIYISE